jgi:hypothetical protein
MGHRQKAFPAEEEAGPEGIRQVAALVMKREA